MDFYSVAKNSVLIASTLYKSDFNYHSNQDFHWEIRVQYDTCVGIHDESIYPPYIYLQLGNSIESGHWKPIYIKNILTCDSDENAIVKENDAFVPEAIRLYVKKAIIIVLDKMNDQNRKRIIEKHVMKTFEDWWNITIEDVKLPIKYS